MEFSTEVVEKMAEILVKEMEKSGQNEGGHTGGHRDMRQRSPPDTLFASEVLRFFTKE